MPVARKRLKSAILRLSGVALLLLFAAAVVFYLQPLWVSDQLLRYHLWNQGVRSDYRVVDGYRIHYLEARPPHGAEGVPLVLIHGLGSRAEDWSAMMPKLAAAGFHIYAPDLLGYGRSAHPDIAYTITDEEKGVADFMQAMHLSHADVGGASMGGWVALKLTLDYPLLVDRLAVYDAAGVYFTPTYRPSVFTPTDSAGLTRLMALLTPHPKALPAFVERAVFRRLGDNAWVIQRSLAAMTSGRELLDFRLHTITQPTLIVWGSADTLIPPASGDVMHRAIPHSVLATVTGCGHLAPVECSDAVARATIGFLSANPASQRGETTLAGPMR